MRRGVANPNGGALICDPREDFGRIILFSLGILIYFESCCMASAQRVARSASPEAVMPALDWGLVCPSIEFEFISTHMGQDYSVPIRVVTVRRSTEFAKCQSPSWKTRAYPSVDKLSSEFPVDSSKRGLWIDGSHINPTKAQCWKLVQQDGKTRSSTFRDLSFLRIQVFQQKKPMKNDASANKVLATKLIEGQ